jgi:hypothetical protein
VSRRPGNFEGAFPLLLIGSVLLIYAAIIANQELASKSSHLPLWGLIGGVGAVIVGAGIYSTFLEPAIAAEPTGTKDWVTIPKEEWDALRSRPRTDSRLAPPTPVPPWWEGPPARGTVPRLRQIGPPIPSKEAEPISGQPSSVVPLPRGNRPTATMSVNRVGESPSAPRVPSSRTAPPLGPTPGAPRKASLNELKEALTELEALVNSDVKPTPRLPSKVGPEEPLSCVDCGRKLRADRPLNRCSRCGRRVCSGCASSARLEYSDLRCLECGMREA